MRIDALSVVLIALGTATGLHAQHGANDTNFAATASEATERRACSDKLSVSIAANWLRALPGETLDKLQDPVVKRAAQVARRGEVDKTTVLAARRMLAYTATVRGIVNQDTVERTITDVRREFKGLKVPALAGALRSEGRGEELRIDAVVRAIRPDGHIACWEAFRDYVVSCDERLAQVPTEGRDARNPWLSVLQQTRPGIDEPSRKFDLPGAQCGVPAVDFFDPLPSGRVTGTYDSLGFPEVVFLKYASGKTCSGTLLSPVWVLTAAHCVLEENIPDDYATLTVSLNREVANSRGNKPSAASPKKDRVFVPSRYRELSEIKVRAEESALYDVALIELDTALDVPLQSAVWQATPPSNFIAALAGYGVNSSEKPDADAANDKLDVGWLKASANAQMIQWAGYDPAADDAEKNSVPCPGDSGGPIFLNAWKGANATGAPELRPSLPAVGCRDERRQIVGVVSFVDAIRNASSWKRSACFQWTRGGGATLAAHLEWICKTSGLYCKAN